MLKAADQLNKLSLLEKTKKKALVINGEVRLTPDCRELKSERMGGEELEMEAFWL